MSRVNSTRRTVLVVDDSLSVRLGLAELLASVALNADVAASVAEAEQALSRNHYALVLLDRHLPDGLSSSLLRRLAASPVNALPVIVLSGSDELEARCDALRLGADFILKPYGPDFLLSRVCSALGQPLPRVGPSLASRVLVVDDSATYGQALAAELRKSGHDVVIAATGNAALQYLALQKPDRIVLDVFLPDADGIELARKLRAGPEGKDIPLLLLTGRESRTTRKRAEEVGVRDFVTKDSSLANVGAWVNQQRAALTQDVDSGAFSSAASAVAVADRPEPPGASVAVSGPSLFDELVAASGLSRVLGRSTIELALRRSGNEPATLTGEGLARSLSAIERTLVTFLPAAEVATRMREIMKLVQESQTDARASK